MCEILSPVGDREGFYTAIKSGCDAVYFGMPKFNARMRAENIDLNTLPELVKYAHLKGVKCYMTLNTILKDSEIREAVDLVGKCLGIGVDAFIVQDLGLIYALKSVYPDINLHGSTQMGIHNIRGAKMAKKLGLSRIVLSRECTIADIKAIKENVDIELEVFIQGAMCVAFSGNCYMSAIKHSASGNRGECKQLCRLNYSLSDGNKKIYGYPLSIRDNCMLDYLEELINLGVASLKIEGRLRHLGYISVATSTYRNAIDNIKNGIPNDYETLKSDLYKVFARGEFIPLYNAGNNVIEPNVNNHIGVEIGTVINCNKFKDIYKTTIKSSTPINSGDGLKFISENDSVSMGVGNVEGIGKNYIVYGKNYIKSGSKVYKTLDAEFENTPRDYVRRKKIDIYFEGLVGNKARLRLSSNGISAEVVGDVCERAKARPVIRETVLEQVSKWDSDIFALGNDDIIIEDIYMPLSSLNDMRRRCLAILVEKLTNTNIDTNKGIDFNDITIKSAELPFDNLLIGDENFADWKSLSDFSGFILSPTEYSVKVISSFIAKYNKHLDKPLIINLPIIAMNEDLKIIDKIVDSFKSSVIFMANNIYAFDYISSGAKIIGGYNLNIINNYALTKYIDFGAAALTSSIEKTFARLTNTYKYSGKCALMTFAHCPQKTLKDNDCSSCDWRTLELLGTVGNFKIRRYKIAKCYFELVDEKELSRSGDNLIVDSRN